MKQVNEFMKVDDIIEKYKEKAKEDVGCEIVALAREIVSDLEMSYDYLSNDETYYQEELAESKLYNLVKNNKIEKLQETSKEQLELIDQLKESLERKNKMLEKISNYIFSDKINFNVANNENLSDIVIRLLQEKEQEIDQLVNEVNNRREETKDYKDRIRNLERENAKLEEELGKKDITIETLCKKVSD